LKIYNRKNLKPEGGLQRKLEDNPKLPAKAL
jgi:hypothetical protein